MLFFCAYALTCAAIGYICSLVANYLSCRKFRTELSNGEIARMCMQWGVTGSGCYKRVQNEFIRRRVMTSPRPAELGRTHIYIDALKAFGSSAHAARIAELTEHFRRVIIDPEHTPDYDFGPLRDWLDRQIEIAHETLERLGSLQTDLHQLRSLMPVLLDL